MTIKDKFNLLRIDAKDLVDAMNSLHHKVRNGLVNENDHKRVFRAHKSLAAWFTPEKHNEN